LHLILKVEFLLGEVEDLAIIEANVVMVI